MIESHISGDLYNKVFSESSKGKCAAFQKYIIKNCSAVRQVFSFRSVYLYPLFPFS